MASMISKQLFSLFILIALGACNGDDQVDPVVPAKIEALGGNGQSWTVGDPLPESLSVRVSDAADNPSPGVTVTWSVLTGGGAISPTSSATNSAGEASAEFTLGPAEGEQRAQAHIPGLTGSPVVFTANGYSQPLIPGNIEATAGNGQSGVVGSQLADSLSVRVSNASGSPVPGVPVNWSVLTGDGAISPTTSTTNSLGVASAAFTLGSTVGEQQAQAEVSGLAGSPVLFTAIATTGTPQVVLRVVAGGNNVPERHSSDLWVHGNYAYTGTWGFIRPELGNVLKVWSLGPTGAPSLVSSVTVPEIGTVSDVQVSDDGQFLMLSGEQGSQGGIYAYSLSDPAHPSFLDSAQVSETGVHTVTLATINGRKYAFAARNPGFSGNPTDDQPALVIYDVTDPRNIAHSATVPVPPFYGIHDTFVRDGLAFTFVWDRGFIIYDVGNGIRGGSPSSPAEVSRLITASNDVGSPAVHNGWWFHNPVTGERRYLFVGQEGPSVIGSESSGDIHVVDVSDLAHPREVAFFHLDGAGTHNFWMDEARQVLYAAYYNAGVVALDVSGTLSGDLSSRLLSQVQPGGSRNTFTWGVQLANGSLYAIDMLTGLWQLSME